MNPKDLLYRWLRRQAANGALAWLGEKMRLLGDAPKDRDLYMAISLVARKLGKDDLRLSDADLVEADRARTQWNPQGWSVDQAGRILLLLSARASDHQFATWLDELCITADVGELVALYRGLPLYPNQPQYALRAAEGVRTNMRAVFEAVAHRNPYPGEQLSEDAWNQMVLKALFIGSPLYPIIALDLRANANLARMLYDYAHERWAAGRPVSPELWRCVGPFADDAGLSDLQRVLQTGTHKERCAAALALAASRHARARSILDSAQDIAAQIKAGALTWAAVATA